MNSTKLQSTAQIAARFSVCNGQTQLSQLAQRAPLKIAKAFAQSDGSVAVCIMDCSPGLLDGDAYDLSWHLEAGAQVSLSNQSFTRVHPAQEIGAQQMQRIVIEAGARLEFLPEPVLLFRDAVFRAECRVEMASQSTLMLSDIVCAGRISRGEEFQFRDWRNNFEVRMDGELIFCSRQKWPILPTKPLCPASPAAWNHRTHYGSFYVFGAQFDAPRGSGLVGRWREELANHPQIWGGASLAPRWGLVASLLGDGAWNVQQAIGALHQRTKDWLKTTCTA